MKINIVEIPIMEPNKMNQLDYTILWSFWVLIKDLENLGRLPKWDWKTEFHCGGFRGRNHFKVF